MFYHSAALKVSHPALLSSHSFRLDDELHTFPLIYYLARSFLDVERSICSHPELHKNVTLKRACCAVAGVGNLQLITHFIHPAHYLWIWSHIIVTHTKHVWRVAQASWAGDKKKMLQQMERDETRSDKFTQPEIYFHFSSRRLGNVAHLHAMETWLRVRRAEDDKVGAWEFFSPSPRKWRMMILRA